MPFVFCSNKLTYKRKYIPLASPSFFSNLKKPFFLNKTQFCYDKHFIYQFQGF